MRWWWWPVERAGQGGAGRGGVNLVVLPTPEAACRRAAEIVAELLAAKPDAVLALPAGNTPRPVYAELARLHRAERLSFARATAFSLDEYVGIAARSPGVLSPLPERRALSATSTCRASARTRPTATAADLDVAVRGLRTAIAAAGGLDLVLLGIGRNGHIAFNEPGSPFDSRTRVVTLTRRHARAAAAGVRRRAGAHASDHDRRRDDPGGAALRAARLRRREGGRRSRGRSTVRRRRRCPRRRCSFTPTRRSSSTPRPRHCRGVSWPESRRRRGGRW